MPCLPETSVTRRFGGRSWRKAVSSRPLRECTTEQASSYRAYDALVRQVARATGCGLVDLQATRESFDGQRMWAEDGIHLTARGHQWLAEAVYAHLQKASQACL